MRYSDDWYGRSDSRHLKNIVESAYKKPRILIGCEASGIIREAFTAVGWDAWSCDIKDTEIPGQHIKDDLMNHLNDGWDIGIFHPECRYLCFSGEQWLKNNPARSAARMEAYEFILKCYNAPIQMVCVENSHSVFLRDTFKKPTQHLQPYHFGDPFKKMTCLWLRGLPPLVPTNILAIGHRYPACHQMGPSPDRSAKRAQTYPGMAAAMADQWGKLKPKK